MLTFLVCLLHVVAILSAPISENYSLDIDHNTLKNVRFIHGPHPVLNLSGMNLQEIEKNAFDRLYDLKSLDLSNNSLTLLPEVIFFNLTRLQTLSLANNRIWNLKYLFFGLWNLQLLDISGNPIKHLIRGSFFGLPKYTRILIDRNNFEKISTDMCSNPQNEKLEGETPQPKIDQVEDEVENEIEDEIDTKSQNAEIYGALDKDTRLKLCKSDGIATLLKVFRGKLAEECIEVPIDFSKRQVDLQNQNNTGFSKDWYQLYNMPIASLDLSSNRIVEIKEETLNNLPTDLTYINFQNNKICKILSQVIENDYLRSLNFKNNLVEVIEDNAFAKTRLHNLNLNGNQLRSLNFVSTLPDTMIKLTLYENRITSIPNTAFSRLSHLSYLNLEKNEIETLQNDVFQNLTSLKRLILVNNVITTIEPAAFKGLTALKILYLQNNFIRDFQASTFAKLTSLETLNLNMNKIVNVTFIDLPRNLDTLYLESNEISALERGSFVGAPRITLSLSSNRISRIARGAFNIPNLRELSLDMNRLTTFESYIYEGLGRLKYLWLRGNKISEIHKGSTRYLESLYLLDISYNSLQKLEAGALYGLNTDAGTNVHIMGNNLKEIQGGLFDDI